MRKSSLAAGAAAVAVAALTAVPVTASAVTPVRDAQGTPMCVTSQLSGSLHDAGGAAGSAFWTLVLTNHSTATCHLTGFPGLSMLDASSRQIGQPAVREHTAYQPVVLKPGASASDTVRSVNHQGTCLPESAQLRIYPPGNTASMRIPARITECYATFTITPLAAGTDGNPVSGSGSSGGSGTSGGSGGTPTAAPSGGQVSTVPSGAPDTGLAAPASHGTSGWTLAAGAGAVLVAGGLGTAALRRRRSQG